LACVLTFVDLTTFGDEQILFIYDSY